ncbi:MAG TPA: hypothetical protein PLX89_27905, partial [Verrucomicrobiota bacterium]|nr:hypothetical protein [Verrucomicrobiota bacterium]
MVFSVEGNPVVLNWLAGVQTGVSQAAYLYVDGQLIAAPVLGTGSGTFGIDPLFQSFRSLHLEFW